MRKKEESGEMHHKKCDGRVRVSSQFLENKQTSIDEKKILETKAEILENKQTSIEEKKILETKAENKQTPIKESKILETKAENNKGRKYTNVY